MPIRLDDNLVPVLKSQMPDLEKKYVEKVSSGTIESTEIPKELNLPYTLSKFASHIGRIAKKAGDYVPVPFLGALLSHTGEFLVNEADDPFSVMVEGMERSNPDLRTVTRNLTTEDMAAFLQIIEKTDPSFKSRLEGQGELDFSRDQKYIIGIMIGSIFAFEDHIEPSVAAEIFTQAVGTNKDGTLNHSRLLPLMDEKGKTYEPLAMEELRSAMLTKRVKLNEEYLNSRDDIEVTKLEEFVNRGRCTSHVEAALTSRNDGPCVGA